MKTKADLLETQKTIGIVKVFKFANSVYYPIIEFQPPNGKAITFTARMGSALPAYKIEELVTVLFDPKSPHEAKVESLFQTYTEALIAIKKK